jgi:type I restriction enzyme M protein
MQDVLDRQALMKYGDLTEDDVRALLLDDKWSATVCDRVIMEVNGLTLALVTRIRQIGERYAEPVGAIDSELQRVSAAVDQHLQEMGLL